MDLSLYSEQRILLHFYGAEDAMQYRKVNNQNVHNNFFKSIWKQRAE